jgi:hypothetical protein
MIKVKAIQGHPYTVSGNNIRLNDYHLIWYLFGKWPIKSLWIQGLDDWAKDNTFRGIEIVKYKQENNIK